MMHADLDREAVMIRNIKNRMISPHSVFRPYGFRPIELSNRNSADTTCKEETMSRETEMLTLQEVPPKDFTLPELTEPLDHFKLQHGLTCLIDMGLHAMAKNDSDNILYAAAFLARALSQAGIEPKYVSNDTVEGGKHA